MEFEKDLFISYAHIDNESLREDQKGWVTNFHRALEIRLSQLLGEHPQIWRDQKLRGNDDFSDEIIDQFPKTALLISVISPRYLKSEWCVREINTFYEVVEKNLGWRVGNKSRIFKVIKTPIALDKHPPKTQGLLGYDFFVEDAMTGRVKELTQVGDKEIEKAYWARMDDLAYDIVDTLEKVRSAEAPRSATVETKVPDSAVRQTVTDTTDTSEPLVVYLAETTYDMKESREVLLREFKQKGFRVLPEEQMPLYGPEYEEKVKELVEQSVLSVHLLGQNYGLVLEGASLSNIVIQNNITIQQSKDKHLPRLIWVPSSVNPADERQQQFIEAVKSDSNVQYGAEVVETPLESLKRLALQKLEAIQEEKDKPAEELVTPPKEAEITHKEALNIYLVCEERDMGSISDLDNYLKSQGYDVSFPDFTGDETAIRQHHQQKLRECDAVLIYYGVGGELWMRAKQTELLKIAGLGRSRPLVNKASILSAPATEAKQRFRSRGAMLINMIDGFSEGAMQPFIEKLKNE